jgi:hypothetical protein
MPAYVTPGWSLPPVYSWKPRADRQRSAQQLPLFVIRAEEVA